MNCNNECNKLCPRLLKSTAVAVTGTAPNQVLTITIAEKELHNLENYCLIVCQSFQSGLTIPVEIKNGKVIIPTMSKKGNTLRADQIKPRQKYSVVYGNDPIHFLTNECMPQTGYKV